VSPHKQTSWPPLTRTAHQPNDLLSLRWPSPPRNILVTKKDRVPNVTDSVLEYTKHIHATYPSISILLEPAAAAEVHERLPFPVYTPLDGDHAAYSAKVDAVSTLGGDGTILHAASLFAGSRRVPPILSFSMGSLGFLGEWRFAEHKRAFRELYMSGAGVGYGRTALADGPHFAARKAREDQERSQDLPVEWPSLRGKAMGPARSARVLLRNRLMVSVTKETVGGGVETITPPVYAMNDVIIHRGSTPHLVELDVFIAGRFLTSAVADGMIVSTPTGSTAYSLSSGGSIVHPLVPSVLLTPICPRSLSFRPLVLPSRSPIALRLGKGNRAEEVEVSIDGVRQDVGLNRGMEVSVSGEKVRDRGGEFGGGVPSVVRAARDDGQEDHWVGGLNGLLKFNYPFGEA
jgi:NADH kinase